MIKIPVDPTNPGQFFACCGLFELADRLWQSPGAVRGWFELDKLHPTFQISVPLGGTLLTLLETARSLRFEIGVAKHEDDEEDESKQPLAPIIIEKPVRMILDWWSDRSIKPWAGSMKERLILRAMLHAVDPSKSDPFEDDKAVLDPLEPGKKKPKKREPFYFDCRRGTNAHPLDSGFSPDVHHYPSCCSPAVEAMCFLGLQRARPAYTEIPNRSRYTVWTKPLPVNAIGPVVCGMVQVPGSQAYSFDNFFRTDQRKHKSFSRATKAQELFPCYKR